MTRQIVVTYDAVDASGMTLQELHDRLGSMLNEGISESQIVRVRTKLGANKHGAVVKTVTVADGGSK
jgi:hypothetical protein